MLLAAAVPPPGRMTLAIHQFTSFNAGFRKPLEGWARAGIRNVELSGQLLDGFLKTESLSAAKRILSDLGLKPVAAGSGVRGVWQANPDRAAGLEHLRVRCGQMGELGVNLLVIPAAAGRW